jgi:hypothetical protein
MLVMLSVGSWNLEIEYLACDMTPMNNVINFRPPMNNVINFRPPFL